MIDHNCRLKCSTCGKTEPATEKDACKPGPPKLSSTVDQMQKCCKLCPGKAIKLINEFRVRALL